MNARNGLAPSDDTAVFDQVAADAQAFAAQLANGPRTVDEIIANRVEHHYREMKARELARAKLDAEHGASLDALPRFVTLSRALAEPDPPVRWRIEGLLPAEGNATLVAPRKAGKTTSVVNLVRNLADGGQFLGEFTVAPPSGRIAVLNYEVSHAQLVRWWRDVPIERTGRIELITLRGHRVPLLTDPGQKWLAEALKRAEIEMVVVDPFGAAFRSAGGQNENDNSEVGRFLSALDEVKTRAGVAELVMPVHGARDAGEGRERARGASVLEDWPDAIWRLSAVDDGHRFFSALGRDVDQAEVGLAYEPRTRGLTVEGAGRAAQRVIDARSAVVRSLYVGELSWSQLEREHVADDGDLRRTDLRAALAALTSEGTVTERQGPRNARLFRLTTPET